MFYACRRRNCRQKLFHLQSYTSHILFKVTCTSNETLSSYRGQEKDVEAIKQCLLDGYDNSFWTCSVSKLGYSGTAIISRVCIFILPSFDHIALINFLYHFLFLFFLLVPSLNSFTYCFMVLVNIITCLTGKAAFSQIWPRHTRS